jgi:hypothetical protein
MKNLKSFESFNQSSQIFGGDDFQFQVLSCGSEPLQENEHGEMYEEGYMQIQFSDGETLDINIGQSIDNEWIIEVSDDIYELTKDEEEIIKDAYIRCSNEPSIVIAK